MNYYPVCLDLREKRCLVVGAGRVGLRKAASLVECQARVTVVSPGFDAGFDTLSVSRIERPFEPADLDGMFLVLAATDSADLNARIASEASGRNILCNIADAPEKSDFILPAVIRRGDLLVAASTSGSSPAFARILKNELEARLDKEDYATFLTLMGRIREKLLGQGHDPERHRDLFRKLIGMGFLARITARDFPGADRLLHDLFGNGFSCRELTDGELP